MSVPPRFVPPPPGKIIGEIFDWPGPVIPAYCVLADGTSKLRATYGDLFVALNQAKGAVTMTNASPSVFTFVAHGLRIGDPVFLETTGALPTGLTADVTYYVMTVPTADTFTVGTTRVIAAPGQPTVTVAVNTSSAGSGVHTLWYSPYGVADATHFTLPLADQAVTAGLGASGAILGVLGANAGENAHTLLTAEAAQKAVSTGNDTPDHAHTLNRVVNALAGAGGNLGTAGGYNESSPNTSGATARHTHPITGTDATTAHNIIQKTLVVRKLIFTGVP